MKSYGQITSRAMEVEGDVRGFFGQHKSDVNTVLDIYRTLMECAKDTMEKIRRIDGGPHHDAEKNRWLSVENDIKAEIGKMDVLFDDARYTGTPVLTNAISRLYGLLKAAEEELETGIEPKISATK